MARPAPPRSRPLSVVRDFRPAPLAQPALAQAYEALFPLVRRPLAARPATAGHRPPRTRAAGQHA